MKSRKMVHINLKYTFKIQDFSKCLHVPIPFSPIYFLSFAYLLLVVII